MGKHFGPVWVLAEQNDRRLEPVSLQLMGKARELAGELGVSCEAVFLGHGIEGTAPELIAAGADRVYLGDSPSLELYQPFQYRDAVCSLARQQAPEIILIGSTFMGREIAPLIAARLGTGLAAHCTGLRLDADKNLEQLIPAYGGLMSILCPSRRPQMATIARGVFTPPPPNPCRKGEIVPIPVPEAADVPVRTLGIVSEPAAGTRLEDAKVVVSGGAGACSPKGWEIIRELARTLDAALGCTRPVVDEGWAPLNTMVGQSGKMVSPIVYIAVGLSGERQHMVGVSGAQLLVAINNDPKSPVFGQVDLGIVEDCREFLPVLIERIKAYRG